MRIEHTGTARARVEPAVAYVTAPSEQGRTDARHRRRVVREHQRAARRFDVLGYFHRTGRRQRVLVDEIRSFFRKNAIERLGRTRVAHPVDVFEGGMASVGEPSHPHAVDQMRFVSAPRRHDH